MIENRKLKIDNCKSVFAFVLGREQKIARAELESVLRRFCFNFYSDKNYPEPCRGMDSANLSLAGNVVLINIERVEEFLKNDIISLLGGTMEIYQIIGIADNIDPDIIYSKISKLSEGHEGRVTFGVSDYSKSFTVDKINTLGLDVKKKLKENFSARFVALRDDSTLSAAAIISNRLHKDGILLGIFSNHGQYLTGKLIGVFNPNEWSRRDFDKPRSDKISGMTPPKLARMIVNIALGKSTKHEARSTKQIQNFKKENSKHVSDFGFRISDFQDVVLLDPFCGSGNILIEAAVLGCKIIGSDISEKAVNNTRANLNWLDQNFQFPISNFQSNFNDQISNSESYKLFQADATKFDFAPVLTNKLTPKKLRSYVIVTEPYLGQPKKFKPTKNAVRGEYTKVKKLYLEFLKNVSGIMYNVSGITIIFPLVETMEGVRYSLFDESIDEIKKMGYTLTDGPFVYGRDYQVVKREIVLLKITKNKSQNTNKLQIQNTKS